MNKGKKVNNVKERIESQAELKRSLTWNFGNTNYRLQPIVFRLELAEPRVYVFHIFWWPKVTWNASGM